MSVSLITFANLGKKANLKTSDITPVIDELVQHHKLTQMICNINTAFPFKPTTEALPLPLRYAIGALRRIGFSLSRQTIEWLFDFFAQYKLVRTEVTLLHGGYFLGRTTKCARKLGSITIDLAVSAHPATNAVIEKDELERINCGAYHGLYTRITERARPYQAADYILALSEFAKQSYADAGIPSDRIFVAAPDIDTDQFSPPADSKKMDTFRVLYMAHTQPLKGLHYLLDAWDTLKLPNAELAIVGGFWEMPKALEDRYFQIFKRSPSITQMGADYQPEKQYQQSSVFVFPSLTEGFGRVTLEAMACGIPVITTENARGIVEDGVTGFVVPIRDAHALAEKIRYLYEHQDEAAQMGLAARRAVEQKKPFGKAVYEIYQDILRRKKRQG